MKRCLAVVLGAAMLLPASVSAERLSELPSSSGTLVKQTEFSNTTAFVDGRRRTQVAPYPINFKNDAGGWEAIDTSLEPAGGGDLSPVALDGDAVIPPSLSEPVVLEHDGREISFQLRGAGGTRSHTDHEVKFSSALPGVDVQYQTRSLGVKETLVLRDAQAPQVFTYDLQADNDLTAVIDGAAIVLRTSSGKERFRINAPAAWDSSVPASYSNAIDLDVERSGAGEWVVTVTPDADWLNSPSRTLPIYIDPDYYWMDATVMRFHGATDCFLQNGTSVNTNFCALTATKATRKGSTVAKPIFKFDVSTAIPSNANVTKARFFAYSPGTAARFDHDMRLRTITSDWDSTATWNNRKTGVPWTTPGGDVSTDPALTGPPDAVGYAGYYYGWDAPLQSVKRWVDGTLPNHGFLLDPEVYANPFDPNNSDYLFTTTESSQTAQWPLLDVTWSIPDATAPPAPTNLSGVSLDPASTDITASVDCPEDAIVQGQATSGTQKCQYRFKLGSGLFGSWIDVPSTNQFFVTGATAGQEVTIEARALDNAGLMSPTTATTLTQGVVQAYEEEDAAAEAVMVAQFGMTSVEAEEWVDVQNAGVANRRILAAGAPGKFAGLWFDNKDRKIHYQTKSGYVLSEVRNAFSLAGLSLGDYQIDVVLDDETELIDQVAAMSAAFDELLKAGLVEVWPIQAGPSVVVSVSSAASSAQVALVQAQVAQATVPAEIRTVGPEALRSTPALGGQCTIRGVPINANDPSVIGDGDALAYRVNGNPQWDTSRCSVNRASVQFDQTGQQLAPRLNACGTAFTADGIAPDTGRYVLTAGHCLPGDGLSRSVITSPWTVGSSGANFLLIGDTLPNRAVGDAPEEFQAGPDGALIAITQPGADDGIASRVFARQPVVSTATPNYPIASVESPIEGQAACLTGAKTGGGCGIVTQTGLNGVGGYKIASCLVRKGDSGSALHRNGAALGTLSSIQLRNSAALLADKATYEARTGPGRFPAVQGGFRCPNGTVQRDNGYGPGVGTVMQGWGAYVGSYDLPSLSARLGVRIRTTAAPQRFPRASITWDKTADIDLYAFYRNAEGEQVISTWVKPTLIPNSLLTIGLRPGLGVETFDETIQSSRGFTLGACYFGPTDGNQNVSVTATITDPNGTIRTQTFQLGSQGDELAFGASPASAFDAPPPGWCRDANASGVIVS